ncbi:MAG: tyrosine-protein phosphatase [Erysipelotrichaceae bacterium]|nr:tyrosine-protein phosphatase [Erysipelotrichaceae bacterium]
MKKLILSLLAMILLFSFTACKQDDDVPAIRKSKIAHETEFGGVYIKTTIEEFNRKGFMFGDSVDVSFSDGQLLEDVPYYNGYYVESGELILVGYPGYPYIKICRNYGPDIWETMSLKDGLTATVTLREAGKYLDTQMARDLHYKDDRSQFPSDEVFANFRMVTVGDIRENIMYRSASPCDNQHNRAPYSDELIEGAGVRFVFNAADTAEKIEKYMAEPSYDSPYYRALYQEGKVLPLGMTMNFESADFRKKIVQGFREIIANEGPYLIHCTEGKDRTGFVCMMIEILCNATYDEIASDYMITYDNYYQVNEKGDKYKYDLILDSYLNDMLRMLAQDKEADVRSLDLKECGRSYLRASGMSDEEIDALVSRFTGE